MSTRERFTFRIGNRAPARRRKLCYSISSRATRSCWGTEYHSSRPIPARRWECPSSLCWCRHLHSGMSKREGGSCSLLRWLPRFLPVGRCGGSRSLRIRVPSRRSYKTKDGAKPRRPATHGETATHVSIVPSEKLLHDIQAALGSKTNRVLAVVIALGDLLPCQCDAVDYGSAQIPTVPDCTEGIKSTSGSHSAKPPRSRRGGGWNWVGVVSGLFNLANDSGVGALERETARHDEGYHEGGGCGRRSFAFG